MPKFRVVGADKESGEEVEMLIGAVSVAEAATKAGTRGVFVSAVENVDQTPSAPPENALNPQITAAVAPDELSQEEKQERLETLRRRMHIGNGILLFGLSVTWAACVCVVSILPNPDAPLGMTSLVVGGLSAMPLVAGVFSFGRYFRSLRKAPNARLWKDVLTTGPKYAMMSFMMLSVLFIVAPIAVVFAGSTHVELPAMMIWIGFAAVFLFLLSYTLRTRCAQCGHFWLAIKTRSDHLGTSTETYQATEQIRFHDREGKFSGGAVVPVERQRTVNHFRVYWQCRGCKHEWAVRASA